MSSYATVYLSDGRSICAFRNGVDQLFFILFTRDDWIELDGEAAWRLVRQTYRDVSVSEAHVTGFRTTAGVLRDRLDILGVPLSVVSAELVKLASERAERLRRFDLGSLLEDQLHAEQLHEEQQEEIDYLDRLTWDEWLVGLRRGLDAGLPVESWGERESLGTPSRLTSLWDGHDPRFQLRAVLEAVPDEEEVTLDLADLLDGGWLEPSVDPREHANALVAYTSQGGLLPIVLTEGRFDVEVLSAALRLRRRHLAEYVKFPDFSLRSEGGAAALRQTVRAFASAGIPNRVLALFDNDTAARDVLRSFTTDALPANIQVTRLPRLGLASEYPTVGPQGEHPMDVNGLATSIELFLGSDVLTDGGAYRPVVWGGYVRSLGAYQGEVSSKDEIHALFRDKVTAATRQPELMGSQDWSGLDLVLDHVLRLLTDSTLIE